ncbi:MAG TPA: DoxX family protein [Waddliaceae bacterium]
MEPTEKSVHEKEACCRGHNHKAYLILRFAFAIVPILAGLDKFFNLLTNWEQYLSPPFNLLGNPHSTMMLVGVIEIIAGIGVWLKPKIFSSIVAVWLLAIIVNLFILGKFYDIALRDLGLLFGALSLACLSCKHDLKCCKK